MDHFILSRTVKELDVDSSVITSKPLFLRKFIFSFMNIRTQLVSVEFDLNMMTGPMSLILGNYIGIVII